MSRTAIWVDGKDRLFANMNRCLDDVNRAARKGLLTAGMNIIADAQDNMRTAGHNKGTLVATGQLRASGKVQELKDGGIDVGFFSSRGKEGYAAYVEYGSKAHWTPEAPIKQWVKKKLRIVGKEQDQVTYLVRRAIARKGTKPHPYFAPAVKKNRRAVVTAISNAVKAVITGNQ